MVPRLGGPMPHPPAGRRALRPELIQQRMRPFSALRPLPLCLLRLTHCPVWRDRIPSGPGRTPAPISSLACVALAVALVGCGEDETVERIRLPHDSGADVTDAGESETDVGSPDAAPRDAGDAQSTDEEPTDEPEEDFDLGDSRTLDVLQDEEVLDNLCNAAGLAALDANAGIEGCEAAIAQCRETVNAPPDGDELPASVALPQDLAALLGCPVTTAELDACVADLIVIASESLSEVSCEAPQVAPLEPVDLLGALSCAPIFLQCPELAEPLLAAALGAQ